MVNRYGMLIFIFFWAIVPTAQCFAEISTSPGSAAPREERSLTDEKARSELTRPREAQSENDITERTGPLDISQSELDSGLDDDFDDFQTEYEDEDLIPDPLEPVNRAFFQFNDKMYFWVAKPVATQYNKLLSEPIRVRVSNFFSNLRMPIRAINCLLQGKIKGTGTELSRFVLNSTIGFLGFNDPAMRNFNLRIREEDFGQTLGFFGLGPGIYINWPIFGPSSIRDTVGSFGDGFLNPLNYLVTPTKYNIAVKGYSRLNSASLVLGEYESLKKAALEPYVSIREAYHQHRQHKIKE
jgi:phospholipid-binding lipoprotein MlaA